MKPPKILQPGEIKKINDYLYTKSGCFAFLVSDAQWIYSEPKAGKEAFEKWSIELYTVYHDYGCEYLRYILSGNDILSFKIRDDLSDARKHVNNINKIFRNNFAHGILDTRSRNRMMGEISKYCIKKVKGQSWNSFFDTVTDDDWRCAANRLKQDSDHLLETLRKWADIAEKDNAALSPRERFGNAEEFKKSISNRVVYDSLDKDFLEHDTRSAMEILDGSAKGDCKQKKSEILLEQWQDNIQKEFLDGKIKTAEEIVLKLKNLLYVVHNPPEASSIAIAEKNGFSLDDF